MSNGTSYPVWIGEAGNIYRYYVYPKIPFAEIRQHPAGYWQGRCYGSRNHPPCPSKLGVFYSQQQALTALSNHCFQIHYIAPAT